MADFKARLEKLKTQRAAFLEKKARQRNAGEEEGEEEDRPSKASALAGLEMKEMKPKTADDKKSD